MEMSLDWEEIASVAIPVLVVGVLLAIGYFRERRNHAAFAEFARRYKLAFQPNQPFKRISLHGKGSFEGKELYAGYVWVRDFVQGIGPATDGRSIAVITLNVGSTARIDRNAPAVQAFLAGSGQLTDTLVAYSFPVRYFKSITIEELEAAFALVRRVAATER